MTMQKKSKKNTKAGYFQGRIEIWIVAFCLIGFSIVFAILAGETPLTVHINGNRIAIVVITLGMYLFVYLFYRIFRKDILEFSSHSFTFAAMAGTGAFIGVLLYSDLAVILHSSASYSIFDLAPVFWRYMAVYYILFLPFLIILIVASTIFYNFYQKAFARASGVFGTAEFANRTYLRINDFYNDDYSLFGKDDREQYLYYPLCNRTIISMSGGGKTAGIAIPALLTENRPVFVHDPKGELWAVTARHRMEKFGRRIILFDPFGITEQESFKKGKEEKLLKRDSINPFSYFPKDNIHYKDRFITSLTSSIVKKEGESRVGTHFEDTAKILIGGAIDLLLSSHRNVNFLDLYNIISDGPIKIKQNITDYINRGKIIPEFLSPHLKEALAILETIGKEEMGSIFSTTLRQIRWLSDSSIRHLFQSDTCDLRDFIKGQSDIFIVLPEDQIREQGRVVRLILTLTASLLIQTDRTELSKKQYLFLLDELGQLGYSEEIENYLEILRGRNCIFWSVFQAYSQIQQYQKPDLFINSKMLQLFSCADPEIMLLIQKLGGTTSVMMNAYSKGETSHNTGATTSIGKSTHEIGTDLIKFNDIREMLFEKQLVFIQGMRPIKCDKTFYFKEKSLMELSDLNPMETGKGI